MTGTSYLRKSYFTGKYIQGNGAIQELPALIDLYGGKAFLLVTPSMLGLVKARGWDQRYTVRVFSGPCSWPEIQALIEEAGQKAHTVIVGLGGGKVVDTAKVVGDKLGLHIIVAPSVAASSAAFSACSVLYSAAGAAESVYYTRHSPDVLLVDNTIIIGADVRYFVAGMADALSTYFEGQACLRSGSPSSLGGKQTFCALAMGRYCYETILTYGPDAKLAYAAGVVTPAVERLIEINLLTAGIAFEGSGLAAAHAIHNGLTILPEIHRYLHGEVVAFSILAELQLGDYSPEEIAAVYAFYRQVGLPATLAGLGLADIGRERLLAVAQAAYADPYLQHEGANITAADIADAMLAADALGKRGEEKYQRSNTAKLRRK